jgi:DeoR/GlpR family transcriptional regulator of sugar metabolism
MTLLLDGGSTVYYAAQLITARPLQVVTNSLLIAGHFSDDEQVDLLVIGGALYPRTGVLVGPIAEAALADLHADLLLFSLAGLFEDGGYNLNIDQAQVERVMLRQAARAVLLMDSSKFGRKSLARVCDIEDAQLIVTDSAVSSKWRRILGERLVVADDQP